MLELARKILQQSVCLNCLGRQFSQLLSGFTNRERGTFILSAIALGIDSGKVTIDGLAPENFLGFRFRHNKDFNSLVEKAEEKECSLCFGFFENIGKFSGRVATRLKGIDFQTFLVGTQLSENLLQAEERLWEKTGIDYCEPLRAEINREVGKQIEKIIGKHADLKKPDISILLDLQNNRIKLQTNPFFLFGYYKKLKRGFPQCKWGTPRKYKTSVEEEIGRPLLKLTNGGDHKFHAAGREDIDARCLDWRAFVVEIDRPKLREIDLKKLEKQIKKGKRVLVSGLRHSDMEIVRKIKKAAPDKTYRALVQLDIPVGKKELKNMNKLLGKIEQRTPERVLHRRADLLRSREVKSLKWKLKGKKSMELVVKGSAGLYIKELISGDNGRTVPSVSELLGCSAKCKELDVVKIEKIKL
ncbi:MAG: tRNA pseudouridine(54/55) synthase Pus10 [Candidatus Aenigmarchaeota archaeon]|nr:tRNA pseudouridine(54/55) synthase Pus10 [Candidatus Aenigmarchaeota archaeon]